MVLPCLVPPAQELIFGCVEEAPPSWKWAGWGDAKAFLFDIIANKRNGIDLDKLVCAAVPVLAAAAWPASSSLSPPCFSYRTTWPGTATTLYVNPMCGALLHADTAR